MKKFIKILLLLTWMGIIFYFSHQTGSESREVSEGFIKWVLGLFTHGNLDSSTLTLVSSMYMTPIRKLAHILEYFILCLLAVGVFKEYGLKKNIIVICSLLFCFIYACSDEFHQCFISNRGPGFVDVLIDSFGSSIYLLMFYLKKERVK